MDKDSKEQFILELKEFMTKPCYDYLRNEYNRRMLKKLEELHKATLTDSDYITRIKAGEISGFKNGFDLMETLIIEYERKEVKE